MKKNQQKYNTLRLRINYRTPSNRGATTKAHQIISLGL